MLQFSDCFKEAVLCQKTTLVFAGLTDTGYDSQKVQADCSFVMMQFLPDPDKHVFPGECQCDGRAQSEELLKRLEEILKSISLRDC
jgi:hypothetical protein